MARDRLKSIFSIIFTAGHGKDWLKARSIVYCKIYIVIASVIILSLTSIMLIGIFTDRVSEYCEWVTPPEFYHFQDDPNDYCKIKWHILLLSPTSWLIAMLLIFVAPVYAAMRYLKRKAKKKCQNQHNS